MDRKESASERGTKRAGVEERKEGRTGDEGEEVGSRVLVPFVCSGLVCAGVDCGLLAEESHGWKSW
jgi:hypothetical protein